MAKHFHHKQQSLIHIYLLLHKSLSARNGPTFYLRNHIYIQHSVVCLLDLKHLHKYDIKFMRGRMKVSTSVLMYCMQVLMSLTFEWHRLTVDYFIKICVRSPVFVVNIKSSLYGTMM